MAYFANGTEGHLYQEKYCVNCIHGRDMYTQDLNDAKFCPVWGLHLDWNSDAVGKNADETKHTVLEMLIPTTKDNWPDECSMFIDIRKLEEYEQLAAEAQGQERLWDRTSESDP